MDLVFNNVYLLTAMAETDPSLEVFFKLMLVSRLYNRYIKANPCVRACLNRLHDGWLVKKTVGYNNVDRNGGLHRYQRTEYRHPRSLWLHRLSGAALSITRDGADWRKDYYINGTELLPHRYRKRKWE